MLLTTPRHLQDAHYRFYPALILIFLRSCGQSGLQTGYGAGQHRTTSRSVSEGKRASQRAENAADDQLNCYQTVSLAIGLAPDGVFILRPACLMSKQA